MNLEELQSALSRDSNNGKLWLDYAIEMDNEMDKGSPANIEEIIVAYKTAQRLIPKLNVDFNIGNLYIKNGQNENGIQILEDALALQPKEYGYCFLANGYLALKNYTKAEQACRDAIKLDPNFDEAYYLLAEAQREISKAAAAESYRKAISLGQNYQIALQRLGSLLISDPHTLDEGIAALKRAVALKETDIWAWLYLGNGLWKKRDMKAAEHAYEQAVKLAPDDPQVKKWYEEFMDDSHGAVPV